MRPEPPTVIWRFFDGRRGHENQVRALTEAICRRASAITVDLPLQPRQFGFRGFLPNRWKSIPPQTPAPDLLIAAGHRTHASLLTCQRLYGGRTVVLMKPGLPLNLFDACIIPLHDRVRTRHPALFRTQGALTQTRPTADINPNLKLILLGGPSRHFRWDTNLVVRTLQHLLSEEPGPWTILTSRRTPAEFTANWQRQSRAAPLLPPESTAAHQLWQQLHTSAGLLVTCDSMSMISEALASPSETSLLRLPAARKSRITTAVDRLIADSPAVSEEIPLHRLPRRVVAPVPEADRCADFLLERLLGVQLSNMVRSNGSRQQLLHPQTAAADTLSRTRI